MTRTRRISRGMKVAIFVAIYALIVVPGNGPTTDAGRIVLAACMFGVLVFWLVRRADRLSSKIEPRGSDHDYSFRATHDGL
jgi:hypothetical protein